jgi:hypothetical protein
MVKLLRSESIQEPREVPRYRGGGALKQHA